MNDLQGDFSKSNPKHPENPSILQHCSAFCIPAEKGSAYKVGPARRPPTVSPNDKHTHTQTKPSTTPRGSRWGWCLVGRKEKQQQQKKTRDKKDVGKICKKSMKQEQREQKSRVQTAREEKFGEKINSSSAKMVIFFPPQSVTTLVFNYFCVYVFFLF